MVSHHTWRVMVFSLDGLLAGNRPHCWRVLLPVACLPATGRDGLQRRSKLYQVLLDQEAWGATLYKVRLRVHLTRYYLSRSCSPGTQAFPITCCPFLFGWRCQGFNLEPFKCKACALPLWPGSLPLKEVCCKGLTKSSHPVYWPGPHLLSFRVTAAQFLLLSPD